MLNGSGALAGFSHADGIPTAEYDTVIVGAGVAGLSFALRLPENRRVALLTKGSLGESNTRYAQGGISAAIGPDDSPNLHEEDTIAAGAGLCDHDAVRFLVEGAPDAVDWLTSLGAVFDRNRSTGRLELGREAAHSRHRVLHAGGDATGAEIERVLVAAARRRRSIDVFENAFCIDLRVVDDACHGLYCQLAGGRQPVRFDAPVVVLAAGGAGQIWSVTSNPPGATADGLAMAIRAGVTIADTEFVQFHPTVMAVPGTDAFLVTEAVRGEGAYLRDSDGNRFMTDLHPLAELAPRDVVARGIQSTMAETDTSQVYLDLRHLDGDVMSDRFPTISRELRRRGLGLTSDLIPVAPAAHYFIGGVAAGVNGLTSMPGLYALGEAACTGVHGANRLASNSLLEGLVFGKQTAEFVASNVPRNAAGAALPAAVMASPVTQNGVLPHPSDITRLVDAAQATMSRHAAVVRDAPGLATATADLERIQAEIRDSAAEHRMTWEAQNLALAGLAVIAAAQFRHESRGAHYRRDYAQTNAELAGKHSLYSAHAGGEWRFGSLAEAFDQPSVHRPSPALAGKH